MLIRLLLVKQGKDERKSPSASTWTTSMGISIIMASRYRNMWRNAVVVQSTGTAAIAQPMRPKESPEQGLSPSVLARRRVCSHKWYLKFFKQKIRSCSPSPPLPKLHSRGQWQMSKQVLEQAANTTTLSKIGTGYLCVKHHC